MCRCRKVLCTHQNTAVRQLNNDIKFFAVISSIPIFAALKVLINAEVAHLVEHNLAKVGVAGSSPVFRSEGPALCGIFFAAPVVELVDTQDLKSCDPQRS